MVMMLPRCFVGSRTPGHLLAPRVHAQGGEAIRLAVSEVGNVVVYGIPGSCQEYPLSSECCNSCSTPWPFRCPECENVAARVPCRAIPCLASRVRTNCRAVPYRAWLWNATRSWSRSCYSENLTRVIFVCHPPTHPQT